MTNQNHQIMRKLQLLLFTIIILFGCQKDSIDLGPDYQKMIGNWVSLKQDYPMKICITAKNKVVIYRSIERGIKFEVIGIDKKELPELNGWQAYTLIGNLKNTDTDFLGLRANSTYDTMEFLTGSEIVDQQLHLEFENKFIRE
jgi:hypothetical protein